MSARIIHSIKIRSVTPLAATAHAINARVYSVLVKRRLRRLSVATGKNNNNILYYYIYRKKNRRRNACVKYKPAHVTTNNCRPTGYIRFIFIFNAYRTFFKISIYIENARRRRCTARRIQRNLFHSRVLFFEIT